MHKKKKKKKEEPKLARSRARSLSPSPTRNTGTLFSSCLWIDVPSHLEDGFSCYLLNKIEL